jgi:hypothetical protein
MQHRDLRFGINTLILWQGLGNSAVIGRRPGAGYLAAISGRDGDHLASGRFGSGMTSVFCAEAICHLRPALTVTSDITPPPHGQCHTIDAG